MMTRRSPSRTSIVFRSFALMSFTICSSTRTSIGLPDAGALAPRSPPPPPPPAPERPEPFFVRFLLLFKVATLEGPVERRQHLAPRVRDHHVVLDPHPAFAREVNSG